MIKLGLIGGTGPESTLIYYKDINKLVNEKTNGKAFPEIAIESLDLCKAMEYMKSEDYKSLKKYIFKKVENLISGGADIISLTAVTMHIIYDELKKEIPIPFISIPETVSELSLKRGYKKVGLIGTIFTMEKDYMKTPFLDKGIEIIVPSESDKELVNDRIANELEYGIIKEQSVNELLSVINKMVSEDNIEAIILGCTELPLALNKDNCPVDCLDAMDIHIKKLVELLQA